jgi:hypothetical protein
MKYGDFYEHSKGGGYFFKCIALPIENRDKLELVGVARYHENDRDINLYQSENKVLFLDSELPHVIYQSESDYKTDKYWVREVDDFFGYKEDKIKRFTLIKDINIYEEQNNENVLEFSDEELEEAVRKINKEVNSGPLEDMINGTNKVKLERSIRAQWEDLDMEYDIKTYYIDESLSSLLEEDDEVNKFVLELLIQLNEETEYEGQTEMLDRLNRCLKALENHMENSR